MATWFTRRNYSGVTVGYFLDTNAHYHGLVLSSSGTEATVDYPKALGTWFTGIHYSGSIVGYYKGSDTLFHDFELKNGVFTSIKYPSSAQVVVGAISDLGAIVGYYQNPAGGGIGFPHGCVYANGVYKTLDDPNGGGTLGGGTSIIPDPWSVPTCTGTRRTLSFIRTAASKPSMHPAARRPVRVG